MQKLSQWQLKVLVGFEQAGPFLKYLNKHYAYYISYWINDFLFLNFIFTNVFVLCKKILDQSLQCRYSFKNLNFIFKLLVQNNTKNYVYIYSAIIPWNMYRTKCIMCIFINRRLNSETPCCHSFIYDKM